MWMGIISVAPEVGVALSVEQWLEARSVSSYAGARCTMSHAFFFNMGGVILREVSVKVVEPKPPAVEGGDNMNIEKTALATVRSTDGQVDEEVADQAGEEVADQADYLATACKTHVSAC